MCVLPVTHISLITSKPSFIRLTNVFYEEERNTNVYDMWPCCPEDSYSWGEQLNTGDSPNCSTTPNTRHPVRAECSPRSSPRCHSGRRAPCAVTRTRMPVSPALPPAPGSGTSVGWSKSLLGKSLLALSAPHRGCHGLDLGGRSEHAQSSAPCQAGQGTAAPGANTFGAEAETTPKTSVPALPQTVAPPRTWQHVDAHHPRLRQEPMWPLRSS